MCVYRDCLEPSDGLQGGRGHHSHHFSQEGDWKTVSTYLTAFAQSLSSAGNLSGILHHLPRLHVGVQWHHVLPPTLTEARSTLHPEASMLLQV